MRMNEFMKDEDKNELLQLLNQFFELSSKTMELVSSI